MSIKKRPNGTYLVYVKRKGVRVRRIARTHAEAKALEAKLRLQASPVEHHGLEEALIKYLQEYAPSLKSPETPKKNGRRLKPFIVGKKLSDAAEVAGKIRADLRAEGLSNSTINRVLSLLRRLCNLAFKRWEWTSIPYGQRIEMLDENEPRHVYPSSATAEEIAALCPLTGNVILLAIYTGLRQGEILRLTPTNIYGDCLVLDARTKNGRPRAVPVPDHALPLLADIPFGVTYAMLRREYEAARKKIGMPKLRFHDLRHGYASALIRSGASLRAVQELLGHTTPVVTQRYAHLATDSLRKVVKKGFEGHSKATKEENGEEQKDITD